MPGQFRIVANRKEGTTPSLKCHVKVIPLFLVLVML